MKLTKILISLSACALLAGCATDSNTNKTSTTNTTVNTATVNTTTVNTAATPNTNASPLPTAVTTNSTADNGHNAKSSTPEAAAQGLFDGWKAKDRTASAKFASDTAVAKLFKEGGGPGGMKFQGCEKEKAGYHCGYTYDGGALIMYVRGNESGYKVESIEFVAD